MNIEDYNAAEAQIHVASQMISLTGKNLVSPNPDDSHTTAKWDSDRGQIVGREFELKGNRYSVFVDAISFSFGINKNDDVMDEIDLHGLTYMQTVEPWKKWLIDAGYDAELDLSLHYELPASDHYKFESFTKPNQAILDSWVANRTLANAAYRKLNEIIGFESDINIWPHHFDSGTYHVFHETDGTADRSIGAGFAVADSMVNEPYFYIYGWFKDKQLDYSDAPSIVGSRWITDGWEGAVLPISAITNNPLEVVSEFYSKTSSYLKDKLK